MYKARNTFSTGSLNFKRGRIYDSIPEGCEGYFETVKEFKEIQGKQIETAQAKPKKYKRKKRK